LREGVACIEDYGRKRNRQRNAQPLHLVPRSCPANASRAISSMPGN
jgi:hypothetical protein